MSWCGSVPSSLSLDVGVGRIGSTPAGTHRLSTGERTGTGTGRETGDGAYVIKTYKTYYADLDKAARQAPELEADPDQRESTVLF